MPTPIAKEKASNKILLPKQRIIEQKSFEKMKNETLFAIFYFQKVIDNAYSDILTRCFIGHL